MASLKDGMRGMRARIATTVARARNGDLSIRTMVLGGAAGLALIVAVIGACKFYEYRATGGVGYVDASEFRLDGDVGVQTKKETFFGLLNPVVEAENARIRETRERLKAARNAAEPPGWVEGVAENYRIEWTGKEWETLLKRVDKVPRELVLVQAANESSWGQSRFAQQGNNMFGQWCFTEGCGIVPAQRTAGLSHEVAAFDSVNEAVRAYLRNINTGGAYRELREIRWNARQNGEQPKATDLAAGLTRYSERGHEYIREIRAMIRVNQPYMQTP